jgi:glyoxylase-like metal-dependent hydrolase (beta-lactamase superfamily II)
MHSKDKRILYQANLYKKISGDNNICLVPQIDFYLDEINELNISHKVIKIHSIPGHTEGSVCFEIGNNLIIGDLFFKNEIGRTDLPGGNFNKIKNSINYILESFFMFNIYPGHGQPFVLTRETIFELKKKIG